MIPPEDCLTPDWNNAAKCHDWKNHVPEYVQNQWQWFTVPQKITLSMWAKELADNEEWE